MCLFKVAYLVLVVAGASTLQPSLQPNHSASGKCPFSSTQLTLPQQDTRDEPLTDGKGPLGLSVSLPSRDYLPFKDEAYRIDLKFDRISLNDIFEIDEHYEADMQRKAHILATRPAGLVLPGVPGVSAAYNACLLSPGMMTFRKCTVTVLASRMLHAIGCCNTTKHVT